MQTYEITFITRENLGEKPFKDLLDKADGHILSISSIGERQFMYPIKKETRGIYTTVLFEVSSEKLSDLNRKLTLTEEILRFLITAKKASALKAMAEAAEKKIVSDAKPEIAPEKIIEPVEIAAPVEIEKPVEIESPELISEPEKVAPPATPERSVLPVGGQAKPKVTKEKTVIAKPVKKPEPTPEVSEEDRLKELDKKLDELLKD